MMLRFAIDWQKLVKFLLVTFYGEDDGGEEPYKKSYRVGT